MYINIKKLTAETWFKNLEQLPFQQCGFIVYFATGNAIVLYNNIGTETFT